MSRGLIVAFATLGLSGVLASTEPVKADFAGAYIGTHIGGNFPEITVTGDFDNADPATYELNPDDWTAGFQAGYNLPFAGFIVGLEGAMSFGSKRDNREVVTPDTGDERDDFASFVFNDTITLTGRVGLPLSASVMPFVKAGIAWADIEGGAADTDDDPPILDVNDLALFNGWETGYVVGGGIEFLWAKNWSVRAEYEYMDFGDVKDVNGDGDTYTTDIINHAVKVGVSYHF